MGVETAGKDITTEEREILSDYRICKDKIRYKGEGISFVKVKPGYFKGDRSLFGKTDENSILYVSDEIKDEFIPPIVVHQVFEENHGHMMSLKEELRYVKENDQLLNDYIDWRIGIIKNNLDNTDLTDEKIQRDMEYLIKERNNS